MNLGNQETGSEWEDYIQELTGDSCFLDGANAVPNQYPVPSQLNNTAGTSNRVRNNEDLRERKKRTDQAYRARCREDREREEGELKMLAAKNVELKDENESLMKEKDTILSPQLESASNEINQLKSESRNLKRTNDCQRIVLDALTEKFASRDELKNLNDEVARLRENFIWDPRMQEKKQLLEERLRLEKENKLLELQNQAYCSMLIQKERRPGEDEDH